MYLSKPEPAFSFPPSVARTVPLKRIKRVRIVWFLLGVIAGAIVAYCIASAVFAEQLYAKRQARAAQLAKAEPAPAVVPVPPMQPPPLPMEVATIQVIPASLTVPAPAAVPMPAAAVAAAPPQPAFPMQVSVPVQRGDTLMSMLTERGIAYNEAQDIVNSMKRVYNPRNLTIGQSLELHLDKSRLDSTKPSVSGLSIAVSPIKTIALNRTSNDSFTTKEIKAPVFKGLARNGGTINSSFYQTGIDSGIPPQMLAEIINAFSYDVDFQRDIQPGDELDVVYERMHTEKGITTGYGNVIYASLTLGDEKLAVYRHTSPDGYSGYYNHKGESVKKALLKTPINGARITSGFGMRMHPLLGYSKMHKGVDFGAAVGTPIYAAGDGIIEEAGFKGTFGNYVKIKHSSKYATAYGHASRIARGIRPGAHVKQGQVIAYVGSTGRSTGPHLHYEILVGGEQVNPAGVKFRTGQTLGGRELAGFKHQVNQVETALATMPRNSQFASLK